MFQDADEGQSMPEGPIEAQLIECEKQYWNAIKNRDVQAAMRLTDDPCLVTGAQGIARISQMQLLQPFVGLLAAWALLGEHIGWLEVAFAALVVALVALGWRMRVARAP